MTSKSDAILKSIEESPKLVKILPKQDDVKTFRLSHGMSFYPYLWAEAESFEKRYREAIPMEEIIGIEFDFVQQFSE